MARKKTAVKRAPTASRAPAAKAQTAAKARPAAKSQTAAKPLPASKSQPAAKPQPAAKVEAAKVEVADVLPSLGAADAFSEAAREQYETALKAFSDGAETIRIQTEETLAATRARMEAASERFRAVGADAMIAARKDVAEAVTFANDLARARSLSDALEIQRDYWTNFFDTRLERSRSLAEASVEATREAFEPVNRSFETALALSPTLDRFFPFASK